MSGAMRPRGVIMRTLNTVGTALVAAVGRLDKSLSPADTIHRLQQHKFTMSDSVYIFHILLASFWLTIMEVPGFPLKLLIPLLYAIALLVPLTSQFFLPATPIFAYLFSFYSSRFIPESWRPSISVSLLPTLETVLYGANISDILTRVTHPFFDVIAWIPYGVGHYTLPFIMGAFIWLFRPKEALHFFGRVFGYMNLLGVIIQIILPCSAPWYELIYGLTPANYGMKGSPGGLARIDALFHTHGYTSAFSNSPLVFGAFPSLHAAWSTLMALTMSHFFPQCTRYVWAYAGILYWATMYLTHHYLIDVVSGACLATAFFYIFLPDELKGPGATALPGQLSQYARLNGGASRNKYDVYDLETPRRANGAGLHAEDFELDETSSDDEEMDITYRSPAAPGSAKPLVPAPQRKQQDQAKKSHRHTASIASLIRGDERSPEDGWSPVAGAFVFPPGGKDRSGRE